MCFTEKGMTRYITGLFAIPFSTTRFGNIQLNFAAVTQRVVALQ